ncbi:hypothetical protein AB0P19_11030 [Microbacterium oleivorans]|uniref:serine O-acetyltransferase n=1 Tax=Microbacterium oleivorans TaxID=273677 RepID=UPI0033D787B2
MGERWPSGLILPHPYGIVIHGHSEIGPDCVIYQGVTIGENGSGNGAPTLGARVRVYANSTILGPVSIGDGAVVGAHSLVLTDVPPGVLVVGAPARVVRELRPDEMSAGGST